jgi:nucleoside-diphosphate-sugar epimerase
MIYGKGLIAKSFSKYKKNRKFIFFASGVSNSLETNLLEYNREIQLLKKVLLKKKKKQIFIYFSSCSVLDPSKKNSLYVKHKLKIENIIKNFDYYYIFRLPNVVGKTSNNFTLINNLIYKLINKKKILAYSGATRNIIDIKDVVSIVDLILKIDLSKNKIINIANKYNNKIIDIISYLSTIFKSQSLIISKKYLIKSSYAINVNYIKKYINLLNIKFHKNYYKEVLNKYYVTKN